MENSDCLNSVTVRKTTITFFLPGFVQVSDYPYPGHIDGNSVDESVGFRYLIGT